MLEIPRHLLSENLPAGSPRILIAGVGNAGVALVDRVTLAGLGKGLDALAINTDSVSLGSSIAPRKLLIGPKTSRGLGTGGDPELGAASAEESEAELTQAIEGAHVVIVCAGLGGGAGSGASPVIVELARRQGALVFVLATLPFPFEGRRRVQQAVEARAELTHTADAFIIFENERMADLSEPLSGVHETFAAADQVLAGTIASIVRITGQEGPIRVTIADILATFRSPGAVCSFGFAEATGGNRAHEAVERALKSPLLARGKALADARAVLVHISAAPDLSLAEIRAIMEVVGKHCDGNLHLGVGIDPDRTSLTVAILSTAGGNKPIRADIPAARVRIPEPETQPPVVEAVRTEESPLPEESATPANASELFDTSPYAVAKAAGSKKPNRPEQKTLSLDPISRGRFEKSEPTIVGGEDLDVPTFMRQKIKLR